MRIKHPIQYELKPRAIRMGMQWLTLTLKNIDSRDLLSLDVRLNSLDAYSIKVQGSGSYIESLGPNEENMIPFQVSANSSGRVYATIDGWKEKNLFHWESPGMVITVAEDVANIESLVALTEAYPAVGEMIKCEAILKAVNSCKDLKLEFWASTPSGEIMELADIRTKNLSPNEEARFSAEITPEEKGVHTIHAYLYDNNRRIGNQVEYVNVK